MSRFTKVRAKRIKLWIQQSTGWRAKAQYALTPGDWKRQVTQLECRTETRAGTTEPQVLEGYFICIQKPVDGKRMPLMYFFTFHILGWRIIKDVEKVCLNLLWRSNHITQHRMEFKVQEGESAWDSAAEVGAWNLLFLSLKLGSEGSLVRFSVFSFVDWSATSALSCLTADSQMN